MRRAIRSRRGDDAGFSLIELLIVLVTLPMVVGAIAVVVITTLQNTTAATQSLYDSADSQVTTASFVRDVQSASMVTTNASASSPSVCMLASAHLLVALELPAASGSGGPSVVSYSWVQLSQRVPGSPSAHERELVRDACTNGSTTVVAHDFSSSALPPPLLTVSPPSQAQADWTPASAISSAVLTAQEPASGLNYQVTAVPRAWSSGSGGTP